MDTEDKEEEDEEEMDSEDKVEGEEGTHMEYKVEDEEEMGTEDKEEDEGMDTQDKAEDEEEMDTQDKAETEEMVLEGAKEDQVGAEEGMRLVVLGEETGIKAAEETALVILEVKEEEGTGTPRAEEAGTVMVLKALGTTEEVAMEAAEILAP